MYFNEKQLSISFQRLSARKRTDGKKSKTHLERTSALMCFLAFDATCKVTGTEKLDLNPNTVDGKANRSLMAIEFSKLVLLSGNSEQQTQVMELGKIAVNEKNPEVRFSSNFLTVPLKKATGQASECHYPSRPSSTRVLKLGEAATGLQWGISYHEDWKASLPKLLSEVKEPTPFTDLAIFVMRNTTLKGKSYTEALSNSLTCRFTNKLMHFWVERIKKEKLLAKHILDDPFSVQHQPFNCAVAGETNCRFEGTHRDALISYIIKLENLLKANQVVFPSLD
jgi:hypothetical protein